MLYRNGLACGHEVIAHSVTCFTNFLKGIYRDGLFVGGFKRYAPIRAEVVARAMRVAAEKDSPGTRIFESDEIARLATP